MPKVKPEEKKQGEREPHPLGDHRLGDWRPTTGSTDHYGLMEGPMTTDPNERKKHFILEEIDQHLLDLKQEERHSLWQGFWFFVMLCCVVAGVVLIIYGLALTVLFQQYDQDPIIYGTGIGLVCTFFCWLIYICCPGSRESIRRKKMKENRKARKNANVSRTVDVKEIPTTLDEEAYKAGIVPFEITEKDKYELHHSKSTGRHIPISKKYLKLGKIVSDDIDLPDFPV
jgi:hypothetical protein